MLFSRPNPSKNFLCIIAPFDTLFNEVAPQSIHSFTTSERSILGIKKAPYKM
nr:MAG TPA: hypothetical protein [Caudoviricetes sp.]